MTVQTSEMKPSKHAKMTDFENAIEVYSYRDYVGVERPSNGGLFQWFSILEDNGDSSSSWPVRSIAISHQLPFHMNTLLIRFERAHQSPTTCTFDVCSLLTM